MTFNEYVNIDIDNKAETVFLHIEQMSSNIDRAGRRALLKGGRIITDRVKQGIKDPPKTGRYYIRGGKRRRASKAGEYPANQTGELRRSVGFQVEGLRKLHIGARADYAGYLETGTRKMEARPFLKNSIKEKSKDFYNFIENEIAKEIT